MSGLPDADRELLEAGEPDPDAEPLYNDVTSCLVWPDEVPDGLSREGYGYVRDLLVARGYLHRGIPVDRWDFGYADRWERWNEALASGLRWTGFRRIGLTAAERDLLRRYLTTEGEL